MAQLLREFYELCEGGVCQDLLTESEKRFVKEGGMILLGPRCRSAIPETATSACTLKVYWSEKLDGTKQVVDDNRALGELDHPDSSIINLVNVSHMVTDIWMDGT